MPDKAPDQTGPIALFLFFSLIVIVTLTFRLEGNNPTKKNNETPSLNASHMEIFESSQKALAGKHYSKALAQLEELIKANPNSLYLKQQMVIYLETAGNLSLAIHHCRLIINKFDGDLSSFYKLAELYIAANKISNSMEFLTQNRHHFVQNTRLIRIQILLELSKNDTKKASEIYKKGIETYGANNMNAMLNSWQYYNIMQRLSL